jgi:hypothetical protein
MRVSMNKEKNVTNKESEMGVEEAEAGREVGL